MVGFVVDDFVGDDVVVGCVFLEGLVGEVVVLGEK